MSDKQKSVGHSGKRIVIWCDDARDVCISRRTQMNGRTGGRMYGTTVRLYDEELGVALSLTLSDLNISASLSAGKYTSNQKFWDYNEIKTNEKRCEMAWQEWEKKVADAKTKARANPSAPCVTCNTTPQPPSRYTLVCDVNWWCPTCANAFCGVAGSGYGNFLTGEHHWTPGSPIPSWAMFPPR